MTTNFGVLLSSTSVFNRVSSVHELKPFDVTLNIRTLHSVLIFSADVGRSLLDLVVVCYTSSSIEVRRGMLGVTVPVGDGSNGKGIDGGHTNYTNKY